ncbi:MAG TPA: HEAT repeat domain-containing protein [Planctomycetota bacterium]|nr:HEAT repeat domain-containing protein [Planctomycetota bacterium]
MLPRPAIFRLPVAVTVLLLSSACGSAPAPPPRLYEPGELSPQDRQALVEAERAYRIGAPDFDARRAALAGEPLTALWLTRLFVRDVLFVRERRDPDQQQAFAAAAGHRDQNEVRAIEQIVAIGGAAVPCLVEDLLKNRQTVPRELGVELLGRIGAPALAALQPLLADSDVRLRRAAVRATAAMPASATTLERLRQSGKDRDFTVRAEALRGLAHGTDVDAVLLRQALAGDADPFVRRVAAESLAGHRDRASAQALIDFLERCSSGGERKGEAVAQASLQKLAGSGGPRTVAAWRTWLLEWREDPAARLRQ